MAGKINEIIHKILLEKSKGVALIETATKTKLLLKGINVSNYGPASEDDPEIIKKLEDIAKEWEIKL